MNTETTLEEMREFFMKALEDKREIHFKTMSGKHLKGTIMTASLNKIVVATPSGFKEAMYHDIAEIES